MAARGRKADAHLVKLGEAILDALDGRTQTWLAGAAEIDGGHLTRVIQGKVDVSVSLVVRLEEALGLGGGDLLRAAGYVDEEITLTAAVSADRSLRPTQRQAIRSLIRSWEQP